MAGSVESQEVVDGAGEVQESGKGRGCRVEVEIRWWHHRVAGTESQPCVPMPGLPETLSSP